MKTLPIDQSDFAFMAVSVDPKCDREGVQTSRKVDEVQVPNWTVQAVASSPFDRPEVIAVTITSPSAPLVTPGQPIQFVRLLARSWDFATSREGSTQVESKNGISFSADSVRPANAKAMTNGSKADTVSVPANA